MIFRTKREKSIDEIIMELDKQTPKGTKKTLTDFSEKFQPELNKVINVLKSSKTEKHIEVSKNMYNLVKKKWDDVIDGNSTLITLIKDEDKRFIELVSSVKSELRERKQQLLLSY